MIISVLTDIVGDMNIGTVQDSLPFKFDYGLSGYYNLSTGNSLFERYVIYDTMSTIDLLARQSGHTDTKFNVILFFLFKSEQDWLPAQHDEFCIQPAIIAAKQFITRCQDANDVINSIKPKAGARQHINLLDVNASGIEVTFEIELRTKDPICLI